MRQTTDLCIYIKIFVFQEGGQPLALWRPPCFRSALLRTGALGMQGSAGQNPAIVLQTCAGALFESRKNAFSSIKRFSSNLYWKDGFSPNYSECQRLQTEYSRKLMKDVLQIPPLYSAFSFSSFRESLAHCDGFWGAIS